MMKVIKYLRNYKKMKEGYRDPEKFAADVSFGIVENFFILSLAALFLLCALSLFVGLHYDSLFFIIFGIVLGILFVIDIAFYIFLRKLFTRLGNKLKTKRKKIFNRSTTIDVIATTSTNAAYDE